MKTRDLSLMAIMLTLIIVLGFIPALPVPFLPVPIILQNLGIMLAGAFLGRNKGAACVFLFLLLYALGLPRGSLANFLSPSGGYLLAYPIAAYLIGAGMEFLGRQLNFTKSLIVFVLFGVLFINLAGALFMCLHAQTANMGVLTILTGALIYLPGDLLKATIAAYLITRLHKQSALLSK